MDFRLSLLFLCYVLFSCTLTNEESFQGVWTHEFCTNDGTFDRTELLISDGEVHVFTTEMDYYFTMDIKTVGNQQQLVSTLDSSIVWMFDYTEDFFFAGPDIQNQVKFERVNGVSHLVNDSIFVQGYRERIMTSELDCR